MPCKSTTPSSSGGESSTGALLYLLKYGYLAPRNGTSALLTAEGLQGRRNLIYQSLLALFLLT